MWKRARAVAQICVGIAAVAFLVWALAKNWTATRAALMRMDPWLSLGAAALILVGLYVNMLSWREVVAALGTRLMRSQAASVFFTSQLGKYIPGGIWPVVASARLGQAFGLTAMQSVGSMTIALLMSVTVSGVFSTGVLFLIPALATEYVAVPIAVIAVGVALLWPPVLNRLIRLGLRVLRRDGGIPPLQQTPFAIAVVWSVASWLCFGLSLSMLAAAMGATDRHGLVAAVSAYALSWLAGFLALIVPAGVGVREAVLTAVLAGTLPGAAVLGIAVVHRVFMTLGDVVMLAFTRRQRRAVLDVADDRVEVS